MLLPKSKKKLLNEGYTHYGKLWGIPIYADDVSPLDVVEVVNVK